MPDPEQSKLHPAQPGRSLTVALVGGGRMAREHARAINRLAPAVRLHAVVDPDPARRAEIREIDPDVVEFSWLAELLARAATDVVHVCTPPATHEALAREALEGGCHVYVEKPFASSAAAAQDLLEFAEARGLSVCAGYQLLFEPPAQRALEYLPALGELAHIESYFSFRTVRRTPDGRLPLAPDLQLVDILPHPVYLLERFLTAAAPEGKTELGEVRVGPGATVHALVSRSGLTASLVVTLDGRPIESYVRLVGTNGLVHADFVRGTVQRLIGPGLSGVDKALNPFRLSRQLFTGTAAALARRVTDRSRSYPGLVEIFDAFYRSIREGTPPPISPSSILETVAICEKIAERLTDTRAHPVEVPAAHGTGGLSVGVTGGTGFLGRALVEALTSQGHKARAVSRRLPPAWQRAVGTEYVVADLAEPLPPALFEDLDVVVHAAAETAGGWPEHERNSLAATEHVVRAAAAAGVRRIIHVSSVAVLASSAGRRPLDESSPLEADPRARGPYVWGKLESERLARRLAREIGVELRIVRPGALVDGRHFEPPGRLGRRIGNVFVAVGSLQDTLEVIEVREAARVMAWMVENFDAAPDLLNLVPPVAPTKRELLEQLRRSNPGLRVVRFPGVLLGAASLTALALQKVLRPGKPAINLRAIFATSHYSAQRTEQLLAAMQQPPRLAHEQDSSPDVATSAPALLAARDTGPRG